MVKNQFFVKITDFVKMKFIIYAKQPFWNQKRASSLSTWKLNLNADLL